MNRLFKALNDATRRSILDMLKDKDLTAGEIADAFQISKPSISHHLDLLKQAGLISYRIDTEGIGMIAYTTQLWQQSMETSLVVLGEKGSIKLGGANLNRLEYCQGDATPPANLSAATAEANTVNWLVNGNHDNAFGLQDALNTRELIERIYALRNEQHVRKTA